MAGCSFQLLGRLKLTFDNEDFTTAITGGKVRLLAYLVLTPDMLQSRKQIAFDFWPDASEKQAMSNLRKLIHDLRKSFPHVDRFLQITPAYIRWKHELPLYSDVREFEQSAQGCTLFELHKAEQLYKGELLPGYYDEWLCAKREQLVQTYMNVLEKLIAILESRREYSLALLLANKMLALNKLSEGTYRTLMRLHAFNNDLAGVVHMYRQLCDVLRAELGIAPSGETVQLLEKLKRSTGESSAAALGRTQSFPQTESFTAGACRVAGTKQGGFSKMSVNPMEKSAGKLNQ